MGKFIDISGQKFGMLTAVKRAGSDGLGNVLWDCSCECGNSKTVRSTTLRRGVTKSCGCMKSEWVRQSRTKHGLTDKNHPKHKEYETKRRLERTYGITPEQYDLMLTEQSNQCKICQTQFDDEATVPHVDHCHSTGKVRGLVCKRCNTGLGMFKDNTEWLKQAIKYLEASHAI